MESSSLNNKSRPIEMKLGESNKSLFWCWVVIVLVLISTAVIRFRLLSIPLERDEGEYAYIAQQMLNGVPPYTSAYSMKLPGIYLVYALIFVTLGESLTAIHLGLLIVNLATILIIFLLGRKFFNPIAGAAAAAGYAIMSLSPGVLGLSANIEHFVILPVLVAFFLVIKYQAQCSISTIFISGLLLGLAFIIKQHAIFFAVFISLYFIYNDISRRPFDFKSIVTRQLVLATGCIIPFLAACLFFLQNGTFDKFWFWTFTYSRQYTTMTGWHEVLRIFTRQFGWARHFAFLLWDLSLAGLVAVIFIKKLRKQAVCVIGLLLFSFISICPGFYFREHYFILLLPAVSLLSGLGFAALADLLFRKFSVLNQIVLTCIIGLAIISYSLYQQRDYIFYNTPVGVCRLIYGDNPFPEVLQISEYIQNHSKPEDKIAVIGSEPQIYFYSRRQAATPYIYTYFLMEIHDHAAQMQEEMIQEVESARPEFLVFIHVPNSWLLKNGSVTTILDWFFSYVENYDTSLIYRWQSRTDGYVPVYDYSSDYKSGSWMAVYKRRQ